MTDKQDDLMEESRSSINGTDDGAEVINIPVRLQDNDQIAVFANHLRVNSGDNLVRMEFAQILRPIIESDEELHQLEEQGVAGHLVARLVIPEDIFRSFVLDMADKLQTTEGQEDGS